LEYDRSVEDLVQILTKFHRDIFVPDIERIVANAVAGFERRLRDEMHSLFDRKAQQITVRPSSFRAPAR